MKIALLAYAYVRQNRWFLLVLALYPWIFVVLLLFAGRRSSLEEFGVMLVQEAFYGAMIAGFSSTAALRNEQRSRRMQGVLAKAVSRAEYLMGFVVGIAVMACALGASMFAGTVLAVSLLGGDLRHVAIYVATMVVCALLLAGYGTMYSTLMHPVLATTFMMATAALPLLGWKHADSGWAVFTPTLPLFRALAQNPFSVHGSVVPIAAMLTAPIEAGACVAIGALVLERRDVTVAVE